MKLMPDAGRRAKRVLLASVVSLALVAGIAGTASASDFDEDGLGYSRERVAEHFPSAPGGPGRSEDHTTKANPGGNGDIGTQRWRWWW